MQKLFSDFKPNTASQWKEQLMKDLKGDAYETLIWHNENGFDVKPFYTSEDLKQAYDPAFSHANWEICVSGKERDSKELNNSLLKRLNSGATSISVVCKGLDLDVALKGVQLNYIHSTFFVDVESLGVLKTFLEKNYNLAELNCSVFPLDFSSFADLENWYKATMEWGVFAGIKTLAADALPYHNQACNAYYEVAVLFAQLAEYLNYYTETQKNLPASQFVVKTGVTSDYFIQMAKLRAIRRLWTILKEEFKIKNELHVIVETSLTNKSISDSYNNLLRTTVEAMAAVSGGCNELIVTHFDTIFPVNKELSERMSVNQQLILREESYFDKMADMACGSFYIESITDAIAKRALDEFKRFEKEGGYFKCLEMGIFTADILSQAAERKEWVGSQKQIVIGVNKFRNEKEKIELPATFIEELRKRSFNNPVVDYELGHYFDLKNA